MDLTEEEEFIYKKDKFITEIKKYINETNNTFNHDLKVKNILIILKITNKYSDIIFNTNKSFRISKRFENIMKQKYVSFIEEVPHEKELVYECKNFLNKYYDDMNFKFDCLAYTLKGLQCKRQNQKKDNPFCCVHTTFNLKIINILSTIFIPDISKICVSKIF